MTRLRSVLFMTGPETHYDKTFAEFVTYSISVKLRMFDVPKSIYLKGRNVEIHISLIRVLKTTSGIL